MNFKKFVYTSGHLDDKTKAIIALVAAVIPSARLDRLLPEARRRAGLDRRSGRRSDGRGSHQLLLQHVLQVPRYERQRAVRRMGVGLRAHTFMSVSLDQKLVELINVAISDINACKPCTSGTSTRPGCAGVTDDQLLECIQCAAHDVRGVSVPEFGRVLIRHQRRNIVLNTSRTVPESGYDRLSSRGARAG